MCKNTLYSRFFAWMYDPFMRRFEERILLKRRRQLLEDVRGKVLELGCGTGINFTLYPAGVQVVACEPSTAMLGYAYERMEQEKKNIKAQIELVNAGIGDAELEKYVPAGGFDAIVCTLVLCTVPDQEAAIAIIKKWLKPEGKLYVIEHIRSAQPLGRFWQNFFNPLWRHLAEGCNLNRQTDKALKAHGFQVEKEEYFTAGLPLYQAVFHR